MTGAGKGPTSEAGGFGRRGWLLLVGVVVAFVVVPIVIYLRPPSLPFFAAYLVLPLVPAVVLALLALWAAADR